MIIATLMLALLQGGVIRAHLHVEAGTVCLSQLRAVDRCDPIGLARVATADRVPETHTGNKGHWGVFQELLKFFSEDEVGGRAEHLVKPVAREGFKPHGPPRDDSWSCASSAWQQTSSTRHDPSG